MNPPVPQQGGVHGDIRHLESVQRGVFIPAPVHGDIRHLENQVTQR